ncbi:hypothetical protein PTQ35_00435 [Campylobacter sp. 46490-21]|uniref:hypothetical protein n=1 Tax=Campylobacter magnus TaxID=3026462 RepID=UPI0023602ADC|nr:hypothetical protein [Campylobacter magnus]MDD0847279.1 hypothetical protein [Campylobacter magnus]MDO2407979.1 hypothetical protein [Campylobacter magnus]
MNRREFLGKFLPKQNSSLGNSRVSKPESFDSENSPTEEQKLQINTATCLAWNDVVCSSCADVCHARAIEFLGLFRPVINEKCDNCNECISSCFKGAINVC